MHRHAEESGQAAVEYVGLVLVVALLATALTAGAPRVARGVQGSVSFRSVTQPHGARARGADADAVLGLPLAEFAERAVLGGAPFDWTTDGCSGPTPAAWERVFRQACARHDFGYRNFGKGLALRSTEAQRRVVDRRFLTDMRALCRATVHWWMALDLVACFEKAQAMYVAVRRFGGPAFYGRGARAASRGRHVEFWVHDTQNPP